MALLHTDSFIPPHPPHGKEYEHAYSSCFTALDTTINSVRVLTVVWNLQVLSDCRTESWERAAGQD